MSSVEDKLLKGTFRGIPFLWSSSVTSGGPKKAVFEYPNKNPRFIESLGGRDETFDMSLIIADVFGDELKSKRMALKNALADPSPGRLVHPVEGTKNVFVDTYSFSDSYASLGKVVVSVSFMETNEQVFPVVGTDNGSLVNSLSGDVTNGINSDIGSNFGVSQIFPSNFSDIEDKMTDISDYFDEKTRIFAKSQSEIDDFSQAAAKFRENIISNIGRPTRLASDITNLFESTNKLGNTSTNQINMSTSFFGFGTNDVPVKRNTVERIERTDNRKLLNAAVNMNALSSVYREIPLGEFTTQDQLDELKSKAEDQYSLVLQQAEVDDVTININKRPKELATFTSRQKYIFSDETMETLSNLRDQVRIFIENAKLSLDKVVTVDINTIPLTVLAYQYYGNLDNVEILTDLNEVINPAFVGGEFKILTS